MQEVVHGILYGRGFTNARAELVEPEPDVLTASGAIEEAQEVLRRGREESPDGHEGSDS